MVYNGASLQLRVAGVTALEALPLFSIRPLSEESHARSVHRYSASSPEYA
jgi:hypothetical protein